MANVTGRDGSSVQGTTRGDGGGGYGGRDGGGYNGGGGGGYGGRDGDGYNDGGGGGYGGKDSGGYGESRGRSRGGGRDGGSGCYKCGESGHMARDCSQGGGGGGGGSLHPLWSVFLMSTGVRRQLFIMPFFLGCGVYLWSDSLCNYPGGFPAKGEFSHSREDDKWWLLPTILLLFKAIQARFVDWNIANLEFKDYSLFSPDPDTFWAYKSVS